MNYADLRVRIIEHCSALDYILQTCADDWHELGQLLNVELESATGIVRSLLPANVDLTAELDYRHGGMTSAEQSRKWIVDLSCRYLAGSQDNLLLVQDSLRERNDPVMRKMTPFAHFVGNHPYYVCSAASTREQIESALRFTVPIPWSLAILTDLPNSDVQRVLKDEQIKLDMLRSISHNAVSVIVGGAFDGEGALVWEREPKKTAI